MKIAWRDPRCLLRRKAAATRSAPIIAPVAHQRVALPAIRHTLLVASEASAIAAESALAKGHGDAGQIIVTHEPMASGAEWRVSIVDTNPPDLVQLPVVTAWLEAIARSVDGDYYGWEPLGDWARGMG
jgi:hypothetical protein